MKYLISILLLCLSGYVMAAPPSCETNPGNPNCSGDYPGYVPNWDDRYDITITMTDQNGVERSANMNGGLDYAQASALYIYATDGVKQFYSDLGELVSKQGRVDNRLVPTPDSPMTAIIQ